MEDPRSLNTVKPLQQWKFGSQNSVAMDDTDGLSGSAGVKSGTGESSSTSTGDSVTGAFSHSHSDRESLEASSGTGAAEK